MEDKPQLKGVLLKIFGNNMVECLQDMPLTANVPPTKIALLASLLHFKPLRQDEVLFHEGAEGDSMYLVYDGRVKATTVDGAGNELVLTEIQAGHFFGEIALLISIPRTCSIVGSVDTILLELRREDLCNFLAHAPQLKENFDRIMKTRTAEHFRKYRTGFFKSIPADKYSVLAHYCTIKIFEAGSVIFEQGEYGDQFYMVANGKVQILVEKDDGSIVEVETKGPGEYFGETGLLQKTPVPSLRDLCIRAVAIQAHVDSQTNLDFNDVHPPGNGDKRHDMMMLSHRDRMAALHVVDRWGGVLQEDDQTILSMEIL